MVLRFSNDGDGEVVERADGHTDIDEVLHIAAYRDKGGRLILGEEDSEHLEGQWRRHLDLEQSRFNISAVKLRVGAGTGRTELKVAVVEWPRAACRVYWSFIAVYVALGLDLFKGSLADGRAVAS